MKKVSYIGLGYVGLPNALLAANHGYAVCGVDCDPEKISLLSQGTCPIPEQGTQSLLDKALTKGTFTLSDHPDCESDYIVIAVPTPFEQGKGPILSFIWQAIDVTIPVLLHKKGVTILLESTLPVGSCQKIIHFIEKKTGLSEGVDFSLTYCPERILPGAILKELIYNDRVIGARNESAHKAANFFYSSFVKGNIYSTSLETAELVKLAENSYRSVNIAWANELARVSEKYKVCVHEVRSLANKHPRVSILQSSPGVGGHCIAVDPLFLTWDCPDQTPLLQTAHTVHSLTQQIAKRSIEEKLILCRQRHGEKTRLVILGLTYKANVPDLRESPALAIAHSFKERQENLYVYDLCLSRTEIEKLGFCSVEDWAKEAEMAVHTVYALLVPHSHFSSLLPFLQLATFVIDPCGYLLSTFHFPSVKNEVVSLSERA